MPDIQIIPESVLQKDGIRYCLARNALGQKVFCVEGNDGTRFQGNRDGEWLVGPLSDVNMNHLRKKFPWLKPVPLGLQTSTGFGDRLGCATPGHVAAMRAAGQGIAPIFAQQSIRENARTLRTPRKVLDDAAWGVMQAGWREPWGADADHLKTVEDATACAKAGYTFFTVDPFDYVDNAAHTAEGDDLAQRFSALPWDALQTTPEAFLQEWVNRAVQLEGTALNFSRKTVMRAMGKYGAAIAHARRMVDTVASLLPAERFEMEISVDETDTPTSPVEHFIIASELIRLEVPFVSLAPRFVGRFEKGVDYIGDRSLFERELILHCAVQQHFGSYKLSVHSGSDKFSIYPLFARHTRGKVHLKTAGTSYLEALRVMARKEPAFFREVMAFAVGRYETDKVSYHVSADLALVPPLWGVDDARLPALLDQFDARQVLHVTFGSALAEFGGALLAYLNTYPLDYAKTLEAHFIKHLQPFSAS
ncbi:MAG: hypothetical protein HPY85_06540 [Anaerolineae bacterium]|nr:hypothetical protein [Anaerolineae bacterium]